eukprot:291296_1
MSSSHDSKDYRQIVIEEDTTVATKILNKTCKLKQECHKLFMKHSFMSQTRGDFCGLASITSTLHYLNGLITFNIENNKIYNQQYIYNNYVKGCLDTKYGISMIQLVQILSSIISDYNLPYCVSYVCVDNYDTLTKTFKNDIEFFHKSFTSQQPFIILGNYWRKIDKHRGGHWSPIINICSDIKSIFIADVSSHRIKPHWIKINDFIPLMYHRVKSTNLPRGYIRIFHNNVADFGAYYKLIINKNNNIYIRMATNLDILTLSKIQVSAWKQTYKGIIDDKYLNSESMTVKKKYKYWMEIFNNNYLISIKQKTSKKYCVYKYVIVICQNNKILGYCTVGMTGRSAIKKTLPILQSYDKNIIINGELYTLYLDNNCPRRQGFGSMLFDCGYNLIKYGFNWNLTVQSYIDKHMKNNNVNKSIENDKKCVMCLWLL